MTNEPTEAMKKAGVASFVDARGSTLNRMKHAYLAMKALDPDFTRSAAVQSSDVVEQAYDKGYQHAIEHIRNGWRSNDRERALAALRAEPPKSIAVDEEGNVL